MKEITIKSLKVNDIWEYCDSHIFAVPEIQREFVWDITKSCKLLDSINRKLPVGSLLIWEANRKYCNHLRHAQEVLPPYEENNNKIWFLLDGQQRLSVLHRIREGHEIKNASGKIINFGNICYSFDKRFSAKFVSVKNKNPDLHIPIKDVLSRKWQLHIKHLSNIKKKEIKSCRSRIRKYPIPVIFVSTSDLNEVRDAFLRINSFGMKVTAADAAFARASRLKLRHLINDLRSSLPKGFNQIDKRVLQLAAAFMMGLKDVGLIPLTNFWTRLEQHKIRKGKVQKDFNKDWLIITRCVKKAVDFLCTEIKLPNLSFLPSTNMLATLSHFYYCNNKAEPNSIQREELRKWFWATAVGSRYTGRGYRQNIIGDLKYFEKLGRKRYGKFIFQEVISAEDIKRTDYQVNSSLKIAYFLMLCLKRPKYLATGAEIPLGETASISNRKDKHHIFPSAVLKRCGIPAKDANSMCNICYLVAEENQTINDHIPNIYFGKYLKKRHFKSVMKSHLIPYRRTNAIWDMNIKRAYRKFQRERLVLIKKSFEELSRNQLFRKE